MIYAHNYVRTFDLIICICSRPLDKYCLYIRRTHTLKFWLPETAHSLTLSYFNFQREYSLFLLTSRNSLTLPVSKTQLNTRNMGAHTFCNLFLYCSALFVRLVPAANTASEISSNPERDKQPTWEKTRSSSDTLLYFCILIPRMKYLVNIHFIVIRTLLISSLSPYYSCRVTYTHAHTQRNI